VPEIDADYLRERADTRARETVAQQDPAPLRVRIVDFDVSFAHLVWLMVKIALAVVPAMILFAAIVFVLAVAARGVFVTFYPYGFPGIR
jgi:hypothetical protein